MTVITIIIPADPPAPRGQRAGPAGQPSGRGQGLVPARRALSPEPKIWPARKKNCTEAAHSFNITMCCYDVQISNPCLDLAKALAIFKNHKRNVARIEADVALRGSLF